MFDFPNVAQVKSAIQRHQRLEYPALPGQTNHLQAGILLPLFWDPEPTILMTLRPSHMRYHGGEVCFPGGKPDPEDQDIRATALREAREELGIERAKVLGSLSSIPLYRSEFRLFPFVAEVRGDGLRASPGEVERILKVSLREVLELEYWDAVPFVLKGKEHRSPVFMLDGLRVFGGTAHAFHELLLIVAPLYGIELPPLRLGRYSWDILLSKKA